MFDGISGIGASRNCLSGVHKPVLRKASCHDSLSDPASEWDAAEA